MGLFENIEKLINEHGSAVILRERIALVKEQYVDLEAKLSDCIKKKVELTAENERLEGINVQHQKEVGSLKERLDRLSTSPDITKTQEKILEKLLHTSVESDVIHAFPLSNPQAVRFHLVELAGSGLIIHRNIGLGVVACDITQEGRRYLLQKGLLK